MPRFILSPILPQFIIKYLTALFSLLLLSASPASAQTSFPDILGDIFGGIGQEQNPYGQRPNENAGQNTVFVENIPVQLSYNRDLLPEDAMLILTAIAPPPANVRRASPLIMGETRLLLSRLAPPLQLVIAVPSDLAREFDHAQIEARIVDRNGNTALSLRDSAQYSGGQPPFLALEPAGAPRVEPNPANPDDYQRPPIAPNAQMISGEISVPNGANMSRGATLVLEVSETALAGGMTPSVILQERIDIDQKPAPYSFKIHVPTGADGALEGPLLTAYIVDWAGRKTFVASRPTPIRHDAAAGTNMPLRIKLDSILTGQRAVDQPNAPYSPPPNVIQNIFGQAQFDAHKGLPKGAILSIALMDKGAVIDEKRIPLDGLSGYVDYNFPLERPIIPGKPPFLTLWATIIDTNGNVLFASENAQSVKDGYSALKLKADVRY
ncbi:MAG: hypothetical protein V3U82_00555 [Robiginitomaculum sp.]